MIASRHFIPLKHLRAVLRLGQLSRYPNWLLMLFPTRLTEDQRLNATRETFRSSQVFHQIDDGCIVAHECANFPVERLVAGVMECSIVYAVADGGSFDLPVAGFVANEHLGRIKLQHLLTGDATKRAARLARRTEDFVYAYSTCAMRDHDWVDAVLVPCQLHTLPATARLATDFDGHSTTITLNDSYSRPWSARRELGG